MSEEIQNTLTDEQVVAEYRAGSRSESDLSLEQMKLAMDSYSESAEAQVEEVQVVEETQTEEVSQEASQEVVEERNRDIERRDELNAANKLKQLEANIERMKTDEDYRKRALGIKEEMQVDPNKDYLADEHLAKIDMMERKLEQMEATEADRQAKDAERQANNQKNDAVDNVFKEINRLSDKFPSIKTSIDFRTYDSKYTAWRAKVGADKVAEYIKNPEARKDIEAPGLSIEDLQKGAKIYDAYDHYQEQANSLKEGYSPSFEDAFKRTTHYEEALRNKFNVAGANNDDALNQRFKEIAAQPTTLNTTTVAEQQGDATAMLRELQKLQAISESRRLTAEESDRMAKIGAYVKQALG
jgi:hypothetical protein